MMGKNHQYRSKHTSKRQQHQGNRQYKKGGDSWKKKGRNGERLNKNQPSNIAAEIEEQLRRQREQQRQKTPEVKEHSTEQPKRNLGSYVYDEERRAYFPRDQMMKRRRQNNPNVSFSLPRNRSFPYQTVRPKQNCSVSLLYQSSASGLDYYKALICSSPSARQALLSEWTGRLRILEETWNIQNWPNHAVTHLRNWGSPSWCRTFDVLDRRTSDGGSSFPVFLNIFDGNAYLSSVFCTYPNDHNHFPPSGHYYSARFLPGRFEQENFAIVLESSPDNDKSYLSAVPIPHDNTLVPALSDILFSTVYPVQVNDVLRLHHSRKLVVVANYDHKYQARPWLDGEICIGDNKSSSNFPKSDVLCIQALCPQQLQHDIAVMGHRNGQTTIYDPRCADACTVTAPDRSGLGNVVQLHCDFSPHRFVARGGNHGTCRLFDIRQGSGGGGGISSNFAAKYHDPMVVHDLVFPADTNLKRTARCRGAATALDGNVLMIPYIKKSESLSIEEGHLGAWCLYSGNYLGSKQVTIAGGDNSSWMELCPTLTHLWEPDNITLSDEGLQTNDARGFPGVGGFWMRCWNRENSQLVCVGINNLLP